MRKILVLFIGFLTVSNSYSQLDKGLDILSNIRSFYDRESNFEMVLRYDYFEDGKITETLPGQIMAKGKLYYAKVGDHLSINNKRCFVHVDNANHQINVFDPQSMNVKELVRLPVDSMVTQISSIHLDTVDGNGRIQVHFKAGLQVSASEFVYDLKSFELKSYAMVMPKKNIYEQKLLITFISYSKQVKDSGVFDESMYVTFGKNAQIIPGEQYKNYQINNFLNLEK